MGVGRVNTATMPVDSTHPDFDAKAKPWRIMRHALEGELAVKHAGVEYLPKLSEQDEEAYQAYKNRAQFFNATARTMASLQGFIFRKDPQVTVTDALAGFMSDATMSGLTFYDYTKEIVREVLSVGRAGTLVDFDADGERRPYVVRYQAENIHNWKTTRLKGRTVLSLLVLFEDSSQWIGLTPKELASGPPDEYDAKTWAQWRVYRLNTDGQGGAYVSCTVYRKKDADKQNGKPEFVIVDASTPTRRGIPLDRIPFVFHNTDNGLSCTGKVPLLDLALVNLSLYRTSADLENGRHFAGIPTPWAAGFGGSDEDEDLALGASVAWATSNPQAKCGFLEFTGQGLKALETAVEHKRSEMAALGARMLEPESKKAEAYDTVAVRGAAEGSALSTIAITCGQTLTAVLQLVAWWMGTEARPEDFVDTKKQQTALNTEFVLSTMPADLITALFNGYQSGALDFESLFFKLQQGDVIPPDRTIEEVRASIEQNPPAMLAATHQPQPTPENA